MQLLILHIYNSTLRLLILQIEHKLLLLGCSLKVYILIEMPSTVLCSLYITQLCAGFCLGFICGWHIQWMSGNIQSLTATFNPYVYARIRSGASFPSCLSASSRHTLYTRRGHRHSLHHLSHRSFSSFSSLHSLCSVLPFTASSIHLTKATHTFAHTDILSAFVWWRTHTHT